MKLFRCKNPVTKQKEYVMAPSIELARDAFAFRFKVKDEDIIRKIKELATGGETFWRFDRDLPTHKHLKRGGYYTSLGEGTVQNATGVTITEGSKLIAYRSTEDQSLWFRDPAEFNDGRFEEVKS